MLFLRASESHGHFSRREVDFASAVAHATAVSLRNARLFQTMRDESKRAAVQRLRAERKLEDLKRFADLYEHVSEGILLVDPDGAIRAANPAAQTSLAALGSLEGRRLQDLAADPADRARLERLAERLDRRHEPGGVEVAVTAQGGSRILSVGASPLGRSGAVVSFRDVTEARRVEEELRQTTHFLENLIDSSADAIVASDMTGKVLLWNKTAEGVTGHPSGEAVGSLNVRALYPDGGAYEVMRMLRSEENGGPGRVEKMRIDIVSREGERIPVSLSAAILYEHGREVATMGIFTDLRERLRIERKLSRAQDKLLRTEKQAMIAELAGTAAHELNQPLTSVMGYAELLRRRIAPDDGNHRAADIIFRESERMAEIVRKIGRITRYETKEYLGNTRIVDLDRSTDDGHDT